MKTSIITLLLVCTTLFSLAQTIKQAEYFIDKDKGIGKNKKLSVTLAANNSFTFHVDLTNVKPGFHRLYIRTKNSKNIWSLTARKTIEVLATSTYANLTKSEYFFDTDPGIGKATGLIVGTTDTAITQSFIANTSGLSPGYHILYIRTKDSDRRWSLSSRRSIEIIKSLDTAKITNAEYFFSSDPGFGKAITNNFANASSNGTFSFTIPYNKIPAGADTLFIRVGNTDLRWSLTKLAKFSGAPALIASNSLPTMSASKASLSQFNIAVSPNPVSGNVLTLNIQHTKQASLQLAVYSMDGKRILTQQLEASGSFSKQIDIGTLSTGTYLLHVNDGREVRSALFLKE